MFCTCSIIIRDWGFVVLELLKNTKIHICTRSSVVCGKSFGGIAIYMHRENSTEGGIRPRLISLKWKGLCVSRFQARIRGATLSLASPTLLANADAQPCAATRRSKLDKTRKRKHFPLSPNSFQFSPNFSQSREASPQRRG